MLLAIVMELTYEQKIGIVFPIAGLAFIAETLIAINAYDQLGTYITPAVDQPWPWKRVIQHSSWDCHSYLIRHQEIGVAALASGITLLIRAYQRSG